MPWGLTGCAPLFMIKKHLVNFQGIIFLGLEAEDFKRHRQVENIVEFKIWRYKRLALERCSFCSTLNKPAEPTTTHNTIPKGWLGCIPLKLYSAIKRSLLDAVFRLQNIAQLYTAKAGKKFDLHHQYEVADPYVARLTTWLCSYTVDSSE